MDGAEKFHAMYVEMCEACKRTGLAEPTPEQWVVMVEVVIAESSVEPCHLPKPGQ